MRETVHDHILERGGAFRERGGALRALINAGKTWLIAYHECVAVAASLPDKESLTGNMGKGMPPYTVAAGETPVMDLFSFDIPPQREPLFNFRLIRLATLALEAEVRRVDVSPSAYVRALVIVNLTQREENASVIHSVLHTNSDRAVKRSTHQPTHTQQSAPGRRFNYDACAEESTKSGQFMPIDRRFTRCNHPKE